MSPVLTPPRPATSPVAIVRVVMVALALVVLLVTATRLTTGEPSYVSELTVVNPTAYKINVEVQGDGRGRLELGMVRREQTSTFEEVIDQGARWVFRFSYGGVAGGELAVTRAEMEAGQWRITIPGSVGERLSVAGLSPSAP